MGAGKNQAEPSVMDIAFPCILSCIPHIAYQMRMMLPIASQTEIFLTGEGRLAGTHPAGSGGKILSPEIGISGNCIGHTGIHCIHGFYYAVAKSHGLGIFSQWIVAFGAVVLPLMIVVDRCIQLWCFFLWMDGTERVGHSHLPPWESPPSLGEHEQVESSLMKGIIGLEIPFWAGYKPFYFAGQQQFCKDVPCVVIMDVLSVIVYGQGNGGVWRRRMYP